MSNDVLDTDMPSPGPIVSRWDRLLLFGGLMVAALVMFVIAFALVPTGIFVLKPRKFVVL